MKIKCCVCEKVVDANKVTGETIYPHRPDLFKEEMYQCPYCDNYVGCKPSGYPKGTIVRKEIKKIRRKIKHLIDEVNSYGDVAVRREIFFYMSKCFGKPFNLYEIEDVETAKRMLVIAEDLNYKYLRKVAYSY